MANLDFEGLQYFKGKENAMLASAYSASKTYAVGDYVMSYGVLYKCNTAITVAEAWTPAHWTAVKLAEDVSGVKSAIDENNSILSFSDYATVAFTIKETGAYIKYADGTTGSSVTYAYTDYIDVTQFISMKYKKAGTTGANPTAGLAFYGAQSEESFLENSGKQIAKSQSAIGYLSDLAYLEIPDGAKYVRFSILADTTTYGEFAVYGKTKLKELSDDFEKISLFYTGNVPFEDLSVSDGYSIFINNTTKKWSTNGSPNCLIAPIPENARYIQITADSEHTGYVALLKTNAHEVDTVPDFATGWNSVTSISIGGTILLSIPSDANYIYILRRRSGIDCTPSSVYSVEYKQIPDVDSTLSVNGDAADAKATGDAINAITGTLAFVDPINVAFSIKETGKYVKYADGSIGASDTYAYTDYILVSPFASLQYKKAGTTGAAPTAGLMFYTANKQYMEGKGVQIAKSQEENGYIEDISTVAVPENAVYVRFTTFADTDTYGDFAVYGTSKLTNAVGIKDYIQEEADRVSEKVRNVQTLNTISFAAVSDLHYKVDNDSIQSALDDMKNGVIAIANQVHLDFYACFGDIIYRLSGGGDYDLGKSEVIACTKILNECFSNNPQIRMVGNHDTNAEAETGYFTANQMNAFTGIYSNMLDKKTDGFGYGYCDIEDKKLRLIVLNTSWYEETPPQGETTYTFGYPQAYWLCQALNLSEKQDASNWQIIILSHIVLDFTDWSETEISKQSAVLAAYESGGTWSGGGYTYSFADGKNAAKLALYINGHSHAYRFKNMRSVNSSGNVVATLSMANIYVPNALNGREENSTDGIKYTKTEGTAESTAFQIITLDPVGKIVYAHHYGAGIDIIMHYEPSTESSLSTGLTDPVWASVDDAVATVSDGEVTPVAEGFVMIWAKSETDNCIECWNYQSVV